MLTVGWCRCSRKLLRRDVYGFGGCPRRSSAKCCSTKWSNWTMWVRASNEFQCEREKSAAGREI